MGGAFFLSQLWYYGKCRGNIVSKFVTWEVQPEAEVKYLKLLELALAACPVAEELGQQLLDACAVRLSDIVDHILVSDEQQIKELETLGWTLYQPGVWRHPLGNFPDIVWADNIELGVVFRVECVAHFCETHKITAEIQGVAGGPYRIVKVYNSPLGGFFAVERGGHAAYDVPLLDHSQIDRARHHKEAFEGRQRHFPDTLAGLNHTEQLVDAAVRDIGAAWACALFFAAERKYWMSRCPAGRTQWERQQDAGIGWANIDHHTYDSSRQWFRYTIRILEKLGYECRELFYAGDQAGWGSQVLEHPVLRSTIFADIDLAPEELAIDFAHMELPPLDKFRRAGVLCAMHGESILDGGLNHVAGLHDQVLLRAQFDKLGIKMMPPFSDFPHLYQELTILTKTRPLTFAKTAQFGRIMKTWSATPGIRGLTNPELTMSCGPLTHDKTCKPRCHRRMA